MKILALSGSPRKKKGITDRILQPFLEGAQEGGAEVSLVYLQGKKIKPCRGCFDCWWKTPGVCAQKDDMAELLKLHAECDVGVYATPLYVCGMSAQLKMFFDRFIPLALPFIEVKNGHCTHPARGKRMTGMAVVSSCGFHELDNFDEMVAHFKAICRLGGIKFYGALLRPHGEFLPFGEQVMKAQVEEVYTAAREAGRQMVKHDNIPDHLLKAVSRELLPRDVFLQGANQYFQNELDKLKKPTA